MGTPDFAVESLKILVENHYNVVGVVTMPDKPAGRGYKVQYSAVKQYALEHQLTLLQPEKLKETSFLDQLSALNADLQIVVAFRMLPEVVWSMPRYGTFNLHASLLPQYRGAAPINWVIINGEKETGATTFFLTHEIDTGKIIMQEKITINENDNAGTVHDKLMLLGAQMVKKTVDLIIAGKADAVDQSVFIPENAELKIAPKIFKETCQMDVNATVEQAHNQVRGLCPYPAVWAELQLPGQSDKTVFKIFETQMELIDHEYLPGTMLTDGKSYLKISLKDGFIHLKNIQTAGKKRMEITEFLRGLRLNV
jgi:methionyl-tRNA formyltransferase